MTNTYSPVTGKLEIGVRPGRHVIDLEHRFQTARAYKEAIAAWGRKQGRSSLSFAVTVPSEPPGALPPINAGPEGSGSPRPVASAVTNGGTPIAWSEDAPTPGEPRPGSMKSRAAETVMTPVSGGTPAVSSAAVASSGAAAPDEPASAAKSPPATASSATLASKSSDPNLVLAATGPSTANSPAPAAAGVNATTGGPDARG